MYGHRCVLSLAIYSWVSVLTWAAVKSILSDVVDSLGDKVVVVCAVYCVVAVVVVAVPSRYRSIRFCGMGSMHGGWLHVVGFGWVRVALWC